VEELRRKRVGVVKERSWTQELERRELKKLFGEAGIGWQ